MDRIRSRFDDKEDRDFDGIPDRIDSSYTSPEELREQKGLKTAQDEVVEQAQQQEEQNRQVRRHRGRR